MIDYITSEKNRPALLSLTRLKKWPLLSSLNLPPLTRPDPLTLSEEDIKKLDAERQYNIASRAPMSRAPSEASYKTDKKSEANKSSSSEEEHVVLASVPDHLAWAEEARLLIDLGDFEPASALVTESLGNAMAFEDKRTEQMALLHLGRLHLVHGENKKALEMLFKSREHGGNVHFWYRSCLLHRDILLSEDNLIGAIKVMQGLHQALKGRATLDERRYRALALGEEGALLTKMGDLPSAEKAFAEAEDILRACECWVDLVCVLVRHIESLLTKESTSQLEDIHHAMALVTEADEKVVNLLMPDVPHVRPAQVSLPAARLLAKVKVLASRLELLISPLEKERNKQMEIEREAELQRGLAFPTMEGRDGSKVLEYLKAQLEEDKGPEIPPLCMEREERALTHAAEALSMAIVPEVQVDAHFAMGRCLRLLAEKHGKLESIWTPPPEPQRPPSSGPSPHQSEGPSRAPSRGSARSPHAARPISPKDPIITITSTADLSSSSLLKLEPVPPPRVGADMPYTEQAIECLTKTIDVAQRIGNDTLAAKAAFELVECVGYTDTAASQRYLCLGQSHLMRSDLLQVWEGVCGPHDRERLALTALKAKSLEAHQKAESFMTRSSPAWKRLQVSATWTDIVQSFPLDWRVLILQHSPNKQHLYLSILSSNTTTIPSEQGQENPVPPLLLRLPPLTTDLLQKQSAFLDLFRRTMLKRDRGEDLPIEVKHHAPAAVASSSSTASSRPTTSTSSSAPVSPNKPNTTLTNSKSLSKSQSTKNKDKDSAASLRSSLPADQPPPPPLPSTYIEPLDAPFAEIIQSLDAFFAPVLPQLIKAIGSSSNKVVIIADEVLSMFPLEAIDPLRRMRAVTRDFSVHLLHQRLVHSIAPGRPAPTFKKSSVAYMVDVRQEDSMPVEHQPPIRSTSRLMTADFAEDILPSLQPVSKDWIGRTGGAIADSGELQRLLTGAGAFLYYGIGTLFNFFPPSCVAGLDLSGCRFGLFAGLVENEQSKRRQSLNEQKRRDAEKRLDSSRMSAALLSLRGMASVATNQWYTCVDQNHTLVKSTLALIMTGHNVSEAVRLSKLGGPVSVVTTAIAHSSAEVAKPPAGKKEKEKATKGDKTGKAPAAVTVPKVVSDESPLSEATPAPLKADIFNTVVYGLPQVVCE